MDKEVRNEFSKIWKKITELEETNNRTSIEKRKTGKVVSTDWYKPGSTIDKLMVLKTEGFFKKPMPISDIVSELKSKDYHLKAPDLTLPLRKIVRKGMLKKTNKLSDGNISPKWLYLEA